MSLDEKDKQLIERYLFGTLDAAEKQQWTLRNADADFQKELALQKDLQMAFRAEGREQIKTRFQQLELERKTDMAEVQKLLPRFPWAGITTVAASVLVLLGVLWWLNGQPLDNQAAFAQYYEAYPNVVAPLTKGEEAGSDRDRAFQLYELGEYQQALSVFESLRQEEEKIFYQGLTYLALGRPQQAAPLLSLTSNNKTSSYRQAAQWYFALAALKMEKLEACRHKLKQIVQEEAHPYADLAAALLADLPQE